MIHYLVVSICYKLLEANLLNRIIISQYNAFKKTRFVTDDLSYKKIASQSSTEFGPNSMYHASYAVDKITTTCMRTRDIGLNSDEKMIWWRVDLGGVYNIYRINILFKNYLHYGLLHLL